MIARLLVPLVTAAVMAASTGCSTTEPDPSPSPAPATTGNSGPDAGEAAPLTGGALFDFE